jgi:PAS domain S-box-containing protein
MPNRKREGPDDPHAAALRASEQRYRDLIAILPDALFIQHGGFVTFANDSAAKLFGAAAPGDLIGRSVMSMFDARHHPAIRKRIERLNAGESVPFVEEHIVRLDGSIREVEVAATPYHDPDGLAVQVVLHDVSERRMLERALVEATEREQMRIGVDLHDGLGQELVAVDLALRAIEQRAQAQDGALRDDIGNARRLVARAVASSRSLARSLAPLALPATGLGTALKDLAAQCSTLYGFDCRYEGESATSPSLTPSAATLGPVNTMNSAALPAQRFPARREARSVALAYCKTARQGRATPREIAVRATRRDGAHAAHRGVGPRSCAFSTLRSSRLALRRVDRRRRAVHGVNRP